MSETLGKVSGTFVKVSGTSTVLNLTNVYPLTLAGSLLRILGNANVSGHRAHRKCLGNCTEIIIFGIFFLQISNEMRTKQFSIFFDFFHFICSIALLLTLAIIETSLLPSEPKGNNASVAYDFKR